MATVRFKYGNSNTLDDLDVKDGQIIFVKDTKELYIDTSYTKDGKTFEKRNKVSANTSIIEFPDISLSSSELNQFTTLYLDIDYANINQDALYDYVLELFPPIEETIENNFKTRCAIQKALFSSSLKDKTITNNKGIEEKDWYIELNRKGEAIPEGMTICAKLILYSYENASQNSYERVYRVDDVDLEYEGAD